MKPLLVGENNPYGPDPHFALYPLPPQSAGGRLCRTILGLSRADYLTIFDRRNLLSQPKWSIRNARASADLIRRMVEKRELGDHIILLGTKVAAAFEIPYEPFKMFQTGRSSFWSSDPFKRNVHFLVLPHPSGRCRAWNDPAAIGRARDAVRAFVPELKEILPPC